MRPPTVQILDFRFWILRIWDFGFCNSSLCEAPGGPHFDFGFLGFWILNHYEAVLYVRPPGLNFGFRILVILDFGTLCSFTPLYKNFGGPTPPCTRILDFASTLCSSPLIQIWDFLFLISDFGDFGFWIVNPQFLHVRPPVVQILDFGFQILGIWGSLYHFL